MMDEQRVVCIVDDEPAVLDIVKRMIESGGYRCRCFASALDLIAVLDPSIDCVVTDLKMPEMDGAELLEKLRELDRLLPVIVLTGHADVSTAVRLMQQGAVSLVEKPFDAQQMLAAVDQAIHGSIDLQSRRKQANDARIRLESLSDDEREVLREMIAGVPNKEIVAKLQVSSRTLDRRRHHILQTMQTDSVAELATVIARHDLLDQ
ncbi:response regulator transcription factor [Novipirellula artificiosorum]|nr:response regulator [Novipirellula artificiosorum]